ncbi:RNA polymerase sigma factor [Lignipirellula cremea]|uniref:RNA polymerase sigma factor n=1 Tax=Lignipirellula cremea TaxID=2528010 RepID=UPI0018D25557|nr:RNA polymerase sigma factor [Lignipirellula cremea]
MTLLQRIRDNESGAWSRLERIYTPLIYLWCVGSLSPEEIADIGQDVLISVSKKIGDFKRDPERPGSFRAWLRTITKRKVIDYVRKKKRQLAAGQGGSDAHQMMNEQPAPEFPENEETGVLYAQAIEIMRSDFPDWYIPAFVRIAIDGESPAHVAQDLGQKASAVYVAKSRVLQRLRSEFQEVIE